MAKGKLNLAITELTRFLNMKKRTFDITNALTLRAWTTKYGVMLTENNFPTDTESYWKEAQRDLYCCIDWIYNYIKNNMKYILISWFNSLPKSITKNYTMRCVFFKFGLAFNLHDFLHDYCFFNVSNLVIQETDNTITFKAKVVPLSMEEIENIFIEPRVKRW